MIVNKKCLECGKDFEYDEKPGFPRKYCFSCGAAKKAQFATNKGTWDGDKLVPPVVRPGEPVKPTIPNRNTTMYVSYAKDLFCAILEKGTLADREDGRLAMQLAIELVKQAKEAFE